MRFFILAIAFVHAAISVAANPTPASALGDVSDAPDSLRCPRVCFADKDCHVPGCGGPCFIDPGAYFGTCAARSAQQAA